MSRNSIAIPSSGDPEKDNLQLKKAQHTIDAIENLECPNGCGALAQIDAHNLKCLVCGFINYSNKPYA